MYLNEIQLGMTETVSKEITSEDIELFAKLSGDINPVHLDNEYAANTQFKKRIAHGLMSVSYFSALFGTKLPGQGCVYISQYSKFKKPIYIGDVVNAFIKVKAINTRTRKVSFKTQCLVDNQVVIDGEAEIYVPK